MLLMTHTFGLIIYYWVTTCKKDQVILMVRGILCQFLLERYGEGGLGHRAPLNSLLHGPSCLYLYQRCSRKQLPGDAGHSPCHTEPTHLLCIF